jgi:hypothetical protein
MLIGTLLLGCIKEQGDYNAAGMYLVVVLWPVVIFCALNSLIIKLIIVLVNTRIRFIAYIIPLLIIALFSLQADTIRKEIYWMLLFILVISNASHYLSSKFNKKDIA